MIIRNWDSRNNLKTWQILVNVAKGLEPETLFLLSDVIKREAPQCD